MLDSNRHFGSENPPYVQHLRFSITCALRIKLRKCFKHFVWFQNLSFLEEIHRIFLPFKNPEYTIRFKQFQLDYSNSELSIGLRLFGSGSGRARAGLELGSSWARAGLGPGSGSGWGLGLSLGWARAGLGLGSGWARAGLGLGF